jgi:hypothetical protein
LKLNDILRSAQNDRRGIIFPYVKPGQNYRLMVDFAPRSGIISPRRITRNHKGKPLIYTPIFRFVLVFLLLAFPLQSGLCAAGADTLPDRARAAGFTPHKALYEIKLAGTKSGSQIANITGQMMYEWQPACDAWVSNHRFNLYYEYADTPAMRIASDFTTYEPFDGKSINFTSQRKRDGELIEELRGDAQVDDTGKGAAIYTLPRGLEFDMPAGSMFPMNHTLNVLDAIRQGKKFYHGVVFDGSDEDGPVEINAVIGKPVPPENVLKSSKDLDATLLKSPAHEIRLAFFPLTNSSEASDYEMNITFHENGIISDMFIEYDDFSITQKLVALEPLGDSCKQPKTGVQ